MAPKSHIHHWKEGRNFLFTKRPIHNHAQPLLDLLSYQSGILCCGSTGEPTETEGHSQSSQELGMQSPPIALWAEQPRPLSSCSGREQLSGQPGHQAVPTVTGTCCDVAPGTELWVEPLSCFHKSHLKMRTVVTAYLGWLWRQPKDGGSAHS